MNSKKQNNKNLCSGGVKWYREKIAETIEQIDNEKFLSQIHTILKKHIEKRGG